MIIKKSAQLSLHSFGRLRGHCLWVIMSQMLKPIFWSP